MVENGMGYMPYLKPDKVIRPLKLIKIQLRSHINASSMYGKG